MQKSMFRERMGCGHEQAESEERSEGETSTQGNLTEGVPQEESSA